MNPGKGIELIAEIAKSLPEVEFHIVGGNYTQVIDVKKRYDNISNLRFHGFVSQGDLNHYFNEFDIMLAPYSDHVYGFKGNKKKSKKGNLSQWMSPLKIFEYMAYKKIIISSDLPVLREILIHNYNSLLCDPNDTQNWINEIKKTVHDLENAKYLGFNAFKDFMEHYTWSKRGEMVLA